MAPNQWYEAYECAFGRLWGVARASNVTIASMARELERLLAQNPSELGTAVRLALADALSRKPRRSRAHLQRFLVEAGEIET